MHRAACDARSGSRFGAPPTGTTRSGFLGNAKGPLAGFFQSFVRDHEGRYRLDRDTTLDAWDLYRERVSAHYGFDDQQHQGTPLPRSLAPYGLAPACTLRISPALVTFVGHLGCTATLHFVLPGDPALAGVRFFQQAAVIDPLLATPAPLAVSNAVAFVAGS